MDKHVVKMQQQPFLMQPVEIIIPFHDETSRVSKLVESIFKTIHANRYLITLVDDCSKNKHFVKQVEKAKVPGLRCLRQETHKGFGAAINFALRNPFKIRTPISWVAVLHSDVVVDNPVWLSNLGEALTRMKPEGVKMVSSVTNNATVESTFLNAVKNEKKEDYILQEGEYLPMYCVLAHRELFARVGEFAEYPYAGLEVEDYSERMRKMGYLQAVCGSSWVHHDGAGTLKNFDNNESVQKILRNAREEFYKNRKTVVNITE